MARLKQSLHLEHDKMRRTGVAHKSCKECTGRDLGTLDFVSSHLQPDVLQQRQLHKNTPFILEVRFLVPRFRYMS